MTIYVILESGQIYGYSDYPDTYVDTFVDLAKSEEDAKRIIDEKVKDREGFLMSTDCYIRTSVCDNGPFEQHLEHPAICIEGAHDDVYYYFVTREI